MAAQVVAQLHDIQRDLNAFLRQDIARKILEEDVHHVVEHILDVGVVMLELGNLVRVGTLSFEQGFNIGENHFFFVILDVAHHFLFVFVIEMAKHGAIFLPAGINDALQMVLNVWETFVEVILVRGFQIRKQVAHVDMFKLLLGRSETAVGVDFAYHEKELGVGMVHLTYLIHVPVAKAQSDAETGQQLQQPAVIRQQFSQFGVF